MPRSALDAELARREPRLRRAVHRALERVRSDTSINTLALALAAGDVGAAMAHISEAKIREAMGGLEGILVDAYFAGGRSGAEDLR